jgi:NADH dehydrogenase
MTAAAAGHRHHVVVVGAGFGGLSTARHLRDAPVDVTVLDARNHHTFQPLLYQVATAGLDGDDIAFPVRGIFGKQANARVRLGEVRSVDLDGRRLHLADGHDLAYDELVLAAGAVTNTFGVPGVEEHAFGLKSLADAMALRTHVLLRFEEADADPVHLHDGTLTVVIAGGGPTGVEMAGGLAELFSKVLRRDFPRLDVRAARVVLLEATDRLLGTFHPKLGDDARRTLEAAGVEVLLERTVARVETDRVVLTDGTAIPTRTMVWAAGVKAHPLAETLGVELTKGGRVVVTDSLEVPGHPEVHVIGDLAGTPDLLPQLAAVAIQGGKHTAAMIGRRLRNEPPTPFHYVDKGTMATIGRHAAVAQLPGGIRLRGLVGWLAWLGLHLVELIGFRNRANVLVNWAWNYLTYDRASRIIPELAVPGDVPGEAGYAISDAKNSRSDTSDTSER